MATEAAIAELRDLINEPDNLDPWTDEYLGGRIDSWEGTLEGLASRLWTKKAATYAEMIDIQEGSSNRKLSQLHSNALTMSRSLLVDESGGAISTRRPSRTRPIERM